MYVLKSKRYGYHDVHFDGYYTGDIYTFQGEKYAVCDTDIKRAKKYSSLKRAEYANECLLRKIVNYVFDVVEMVGEG